MLITTKQLVYLFFAAMIVGILYTFINGAAVKKLAKRLVESGADKEETAKTVAELGFSGKLQTYVIRKSALGGSALSKLICKVERTPAPIGNADPELLFTPKAEYAYYIPEENRNKSFKRHMNETVSLRAALILIAVMIAVMLCAASVIDFLGDWAVGLVTSDRTPVVGVDPPDDSLLAEQERLNEAERLDKELFGEENDTQEENAIPNETVNENPNEEPSNPQAE